MTNTLFTHYHNLRSKLTKFDSLILEERRKELEEIIAALRRGEIPDIKTD